MKWSDSVDIAQALLNKHPQVDCESAADNQLYQMIIQLDDFQGTNTEYKAKSLRDIRGAWNDIKYEGFTLDMIRDLKTFSEPTPFSPSHEMDGRSPLQTKANRRQIIDNDTCPGR